MLPADLCQTLPEPPHVVLPLWCTSRVWAGHNSTDSPLRFYRLTIVRPAVVAGCMMTHAQEEVRGELTSKEVAPTVGTLIHTDTLPKMRRQMAPLLGLMKVAGSPGPATGVLLLSELPHQHLVIGLAQAHSSTFPVAASLGIPLANSYASSRHVNHNRR